MYLRVLLYLILFGVLLFIQLAILPNLPWGLSYLNIILVCSVLSLVILDFNRTLAWWLGGAWLMGLFSQYPAGLILVSAVNLLLVHWLLVNIFTNRSLYALLFLTGLALIINDLGLLAWQFHLANLNNLAWLPLDSGFWLLLVKRLGWNLLLMIALFYSLNFLSLRFRPVLSKR